MKHEQNLLLKTTSDLGPNFLDAGRGGLLVRTARSQLAELRGAFTIGEPFDMGSSRCV
jgi:hypothetical protein